MKFLLSLLLAFLLFFGGISLAYFLLPKAYVVHYHANMAVFIDGKQWDFTGNQYMEEVSRCNIQEGVLPEDRIHLHENKGELVHVHMAASTWGDLFSNLYWNFGSGYLVDDFGKMYRSENGKNVYYILNGVMVDNPHNRPVASEDRLLIWYGSGTADEVIKNEFPRVANNAKEYNHKADPASCSTNIESGFWGAIKEMLLSHHSE